jgi:septal ring factor EnvC (AmiA/AmiB activator)
LSIQYREKADGILQFKKKEKKKSFGPRWILLQCLTTLFLAFMVFIIGYNNCRTPQFSDVTIEKKIGDLNQEYDYKKAYQECLEKDLKNLKQLLEKLESQVKNSNKNRVTS